MDYQKHYDLLIKRGKSRSLSGYKERHHIIPKCMGGSDEENNLVYLTASEHYVAHQLLAKIYPGNQGLIFAVHMMASSLNGRNNKSYSWVRQKAAKIHGDRTRGIKRPPRTKEWSNKISKSLMGKTQTSESNKKRSDKMKGIEKSDSMKSNMSLAAKNRSKEHQDNLNSAHKGKTRSEETKEKMRLVSLRQEIITCPHCGKSGKPRGMKCWHFDKCREKRYGV